jgi:peptidoglycan/LPS O-acetylase OafA/YrhL
MMNKVYFPNLNGLRFIAAFLVIIHHLDQFRLILGMPNFWRVPFVAVIGQLGVVLFFVLSGFLITYLLLAEEKKTGTISVRKFYTRRILRIWPLYYLIVLASFFLLYRISFLNVGILSEAVWQSGAAVKLLLFLLFLPNIAYALYLPVPYASQSWSVGVEEQFYLVWPWLMKKAKNKQRTLLTIIIGYLLVKFLLLIAHKLYANNYLELVLGIWGNFSIDCMAIGGVFALLLFRDDPRLKLIFNRGVQFTVTALLLVLLALGKVIPYIHNEAYALLFGILIINLAANPNRIFSLETPWLNYLGKISYGLYMYHPLAVVTGLKLLDHLGIRTMIIQYILCVSLTMILAALSYELFEKRYIRMKTKYSEIISGENAMPETKIPPITILLKDHETNSL